MDFRTALGTMALAGAVAAGCGSTEIREVGASSPDTTADVHPLSQGLENRVVGEVRISADATHLTIAVTGHAQDVSDIRVCLGVSAFRYVNPEACGYRAAIAGGEPTAALAIPLTDLKEPVAGDMVYVQVAARLAGGDAWAYAGTFKGRVGYTVPDAGVSADAADGCVLSAGDWAGEKAPWPEDELVLGDSSYAREDLLSILATPAAGDASVLLAKQVIAAKLNASMGVKLPLGVAAALPAMDGWFASQKDGDGSLPFGVVATPEYELNSEAFDRGVNSAEMIRQFNAGKLDVRSCE